MILSETMETSWLRFHLFEFPDMIKTCQDEQTDAHWPAFVDLAVSNLDTPKTDRYKAYD